VVHRVVASAAVAHPGVLADQWVDDWCSCVRCSEDETSIILKNLKNRGKSEIIFLTNSFVINMSLRASGLARLVSYG
jgi:hypothetical protein